MIVLLQKEFVNRKICCLNPNAKILINIGFVQEYGDTVPDELLAQKWFHLHETQDV